MITVGIITKNEQDNIEDCLDSALRLTSNILVIDSYSIDNTIGIAKRYNNIKLIFNKFNDFVTQKNLLIKHAETRWLFVLDADERISKELAMEIKDIVSRENISGYYIPRKSYYLNRYIRHCGWWPDYVLRLFQKDRASFQGNLVHENVRIKGDIGKLTNPILHYPYKNMRHHIEKINLYTDLYAEGNPDKKVSISSILFIPIFSFVKKYFLQFGILDGKAGIILSLMTSYYNFIKYIKIYEKKVRKSNHDHK